MFFTIHNHQKNYFVFKVKMRLFYLFFIIFSKQNIMSYWFIIIFKLFLIFDIHGKLISLQLYLSKKDIKFDIFSGWLLIFSWFRGLLLRTENICHHSFADFFWFLSSQENVCIMCHEMDLFYDICNMFYQYYQKRNRYSSFMLKTYLRSSKKWTKSLLIISFV